MLAKKLIYYVLAAFVIGTLVLVYIQYNSSKNINQLIDGNTRLLSEVRLINELKDLEQEVLTADQLIQKPTAHEWQNLESRVQLKLQEIESFPELETTQLLRQKLQEMLEQKLKLSRLYLKTGNETTLAETRLLTESILQTIQGIDSTRRRLLEEATVDIDRSGVRALRLGTILIVLVLLSAAFLFWYIINIIQRQSRLIVALNESERKVKESARVKENFLANMSHEIRTPLNAVLGFTQLLERQKLDQKGKEYAGIIRSSGEGLLTIINDILDVSKMEAGMIRLEKAPFQIGPLVESVAALFAGRSSEKGIDLLVEVAEDLPEWLLGDANRLSQILGNLLSNAIKFTESGKVELLVTTTKQNSGIQLVQFTVSDTGIGIAKNHIDHIFERFQQAEESTTRRYGGTGLGLWIVRELVLLQKGDVQVDSQPGKGSRFRVSIPFEEASSNLKSAIHAKSSGQPQRATSTPVSILAAEDNELNQRLLQHLFREWNIKAGFVSNGRQALEELAKQPYDLLLLDIQMPELDGYSVAMKLRTELKSAIPIIAMTAHALPGERERCLAAGMNEYLAKPIKEQELYDMIQRFAPKPVIAGVGGENFQYIHLAYMQSISAGDKAYEKEISAQFIEILPGDLLQLQTAVQNGDNAAVKKIAHSLRTSVSVMGMDEPLKPWLDELEYADGSETETQRAFSSLKWYCEQALLEAEQFYHSL